MENLTYQIMELWWRGVQTLAGDIAVNDALEKFILDCGKTYFSDDIQRSVENLTNSEKRRLKSNMELVIAELGL